MGKYFGIGVGPGDPELLTLKAVRILQAAQVVCYIANPQGQSMARDIVAQYLKPNQCELPISITMDVDRSQTIKSYDSATSQMSEYLLQGNNVAVLCLGDPLFYGSFNYIYERLMGKFECEVIPGITSLSAASAVSKKSFSYLSDRVAIVSAKNNDAQIKNALHTFDSVAILKAGRERKRLLQLIEQCGRWHDTVYVEKASYEDQHVFHDLNDVPQTQGSYFSLFLTTAKRQK